jgi:hypothetical protein
MIFARIYDSVITKIQYVLDYSGLIRKIKESYSVSDETFFDVDKNLIDESIISDETIYSVDKNVTDESTQSDETFFDFEKPIEDYYEYTENIQNLDFYKNSFENVDAIENILFNDSIVKRDSIASTDLFYATPNLVLVEGPYTYNDFVEPTYYDPYFEITDQIQPFLIGKGITDIPIITDNISNFDINSVLNDRPIILDNLSYNLTTQFPSDSVLNISDQPFLQFQPFIPVELLEFSDVVDIQPTLNKFDDINIISVVDIVPIKSITETSIISEYSTKELSLYLEEGSYEKSYGDFVVSDYYLSEGFSVSEIITI